MSIVVMGAVFVDIKGYPISSYIPGGRNAGRVVQVHGRCQKAPEPQGRHALHPHHAQRHGHLARDL